MKPIFTFLCLALFFQSNAQEKDAPSIINECIKKHGGDHYKKAHYAYDFRKYHYEFHIEDGQYQYERHSKDGKTKDILTNDGFKRKVDGKEIELTEKKKRGYGHNVVIDHGYGYTTLYAHMKTIDVKKGEKVVKGQKIGEIGSTGTSTAPHLHYEVRINGRAVNPIDYCLDGLSPSEYKELVLKASEENQSFD